MGGENNLINFDELLFNINQELSKNQELYNNNNISENLSSSYSQEELSFINSTYLSLQSNFIQTIENFLNNLSINFKENSKLIDKNQDGSFFFSKLKKQMEDLNLKIDNCEAIYKNFFIETQNFLNQSLPNNTNKINYLNALYNKKRSGLKELIKYIINERDKFNNFLNFYQTNVNTYNLEYKDINYYLENLKKIPQEYQDITNISKHLLIYKKFLDKYNTFALLLFYNFEIKLEDESKKYEGFIDNFFFNECKKIESYNQNIIKEKEKKLLDENLKKKEEKLNEMLDKNSYPEEFGETLKNINLEKEKEEKELNIIFNLQALVNIALEKEKEEKEEIEKNKKIKEILNKNINLISIYEFDLLKLEDIIFYIKDFLKTEKNTDFTIKLSEYIKLFTLKFIKDHESNQFLKNLNKDIYENYHEYSYNAFCSHFPIGENAIIKEDFKIEKILLYMHLLNFNETLLKLELLKISESQNKILCDYNNFYSEIINIPKEINDLVKKGAELTKIQNDYEFIEIPNIQNLSKELKNLLESNQSQDNEFHKKIENFCKKIKKIYDDKKIFNEAEKDFRSRKENIIHNIIFKENLSKIIYFGQFLFTACINDFNNDLNYLKLSNNISKLFDNLEIKKYFIKNNFDEYSGELIIKDLIKINKYFKNLPSDLLEFIKDQNTTFNLNDQIDFIKNYELRSIDLKTKYRNILSDFINNEFSSIHKFILNQKELLFHNAENSINSQNYKDQQKEIFENINKKYKNISSLIQKFLENFEDIINKNKDENSLEYYKNLKSHKQNLEKFCLIIDDSLGNQSKNLNQNQLTNMNTSTNTEYKFNLIEKCIDENKKNCNLVLTQISDCIIILQDLEKKKNFSRS